jgi:cytochrome o ubiquinol oxidase subunit II
MKGKQRGVTNFLRVGLALVVVIVAIAFASQGGRLDILMPQGTVAAQQKNLLVFAALLSLVVVIPVFAMTFWFAWKYRAENTKANYSPEWDSSNKVEFVMWGVPILLIGILSVVTWKSTHQLDPFKPLSSETKPLTIQVVAMRWKWLFIYPEQKIATVNYVQFPDSTPVNFEITADAPMNSFWIPQLGGQIYAMNGMETKLHLDATQIGTYEGVSANISGRGFAGMRFSAVASTPADFEAFITSAKQSGSSLNSTTYDGLTAPSENNQPAYYALAEDDLHHNIMMKYNIPMGMSSGSKHMEGHGH